MPNSGSTKTTLTLSELKLSWPTMSLLERAHAVAQLRGRFRSNRALSAALDVDEGTVRRLLRLEALKPADQALIEEGKSSKVVLKEAKIHATHDAFEQLLASGDAEQGFIDSRALLVLEWFEKEEIAPKFVERIVDEIDRRLYFMHSPLDELAHPDADVWKIIAKTKPANTGDVFWPNYYIEWGVVWIPRLVPRQVWAPVLAKARNIAVALSIHYEWKLPKTSSPGHQHGL